MSDESSRITGSPVSRLARLLVPAFVACLVFPATAYAHSAGPIIVLALVVFVSAAALAGLTKWLMKRFSFIIDADVPGTTILKVQSAETLLMVVSSLLALWVVENAKPLQMVGYFSLAGAEWYYSKVMNTTTPHLFVSQEILWWTAIQAVVALLPNLALLRGKEGGLSRFLAVVKKFMYALLLGWISLGLIWGLIAVTEYPRIAYEHEHFVFKKEAGRAHESVELMRIASSKGFLGLARRLVEEGFDVNSITDPHGTTPLMLASLSGHIDLVRLLLDRGADINQQAPPIGGTALMCAASRGQKEVVKELLRKGARTDVKDKNGWTALRFADRIGHKEIVAILQKGVSGN